MGIGRALVLSGAAAAALSATAPAAVRIPAGDLSTGPALTSDAIVYGRQAKDRFAIIRRPIASRTARVIARERIKAPYYELSVEAAGAQVGYAVTTRRARDDGPKIGVVYVPHRSRLARGPQSGPLRAVANCEYPNPGYPEQPPTLALDGMSWAYVAEPGCTSSAGVLDPGMHVGTQRASKPVVIKLEPTRDYNAASAPVLAGPYLAWARWNGTATLSLNVVNLQTGVVAPRIPVDPEVGGFQFPLRERSFDIQLDGKYAFAERTVRREDGKIVDRTQVSWASASDSTRHTIARSGVASPIRMADGGIFFWEQVADTWQLVRAELDGTRQALTVAPEPSAYDIDAGRVAVFARCPMGRSVVVFAIAETSDAPVDLCP